MDAPTIQHADPTMAHLHRSLGFLHDTWVIARRGLLHLRRQPEQLSDATIQPVMFVLLFAYVFGGAIDVPGGGQYREFLMGGIFAQTVVFTAFGVALSLASDRKNQAVDRFRSLPIARGALLGGHALTSLLKAMLPIVLMSLCGLAIGWRIHASALDAVAGYGLLTAFAFAMIWVGILLGSVIATPEGVTGIAFSVLFPVTFMASTFVPTSTMPAAIRLVAEWNPVTTLSDALRILFGNPIRRPPSTIHGQSLIRLRTRSSGSSPSWSSAPRSVRRYDRKLWIGRWRESAAYLPS